MATKNNQNEFKDFLLTEGKKYLGSRVGDVLNFLHELDQNSKSIGTRELADSAEKAVNQIRRILHSTWHSNNKKYLKTLQKVGVYLMKAIEEKGDLPGAITASSQELEKLTQELGVPVNSMGSPGTSTDQQDQSGVEPQEDNSNKQTTVNQPPPENAQTPQQPPQAN